MQVFRLSLRRVENLPGMLEFRVPAFSALCKCRKRILFWIWNELLKITAGYKHFVVAVDSTGFSRINPSFHCIKRIDRKKPVKSYVKVSSFFDVRKRKFLALRIRIKTRHDAKDINYLLKQNRNFKKLSGDSAYDSEKIHERCFDLDIKAVIKPKKNAEKGFYRKKQRKYYSEDEYHERNMIESRQGGEKRMYGGYVFAEKIQGIKSEIYCKAIAYNLSLNN